MSKVFENETDPVYLKPRQVPKELNNRGLQKIENKQKDPKTKH